MTSQLILISDSEEEDDDGDALDACSDDDEILEAGPAIVVKDAESSRVDVRSKRSTPAQAGPLQQIGPQNDL